MVNGHLCAPCQRSLLTVSSASFDLDLGDNMPLIVLMLDQLSFIVIDGVGAYCVAMASRTAIMGFLRRYISFACIHFYICPRPRTRMASPLPPPNGMVSFCAACGGRGVVWGGGRVRGWAEDLDEDEVYRFRTETANDTIDGKEMH